MIAASDTLTISYDSGFWVILPFIIFGIIALSFMAGWFAALGRIEKDRAPGSLPVGAPDPLSLAPADPVGGRPGEWNATPVTGASDRCFVNLYREGEMILVLSMQRGRVEHHLSRRMMESYNPRDWSIVERPSDRLDGGIVISLEPVPVSEIHASTCGLGPNHPGECTP